MKLKPINDKILVKEIIPDEKTESGIIMTQTNPSRRRKGKVISVGPGFRKDNGEFSPVSVNPGDEILFNYASGNEVEVEGEKFQMIREVDIVGVFEE
jgi:chaperonin GroES